MKKDVMTLKPGILVSLKTSMRGGVTYERKDLNAGAVAEVEEGESNTTVEKWETTKIVADDKEFKAATKARSKCGALIRAVCSHSAFGLICPESREKELNEAITEAKAMAAKFNGDASNTNITLYVLKGRIASNDEEAVKAIASELRDLLDAMRDGIGAGDVEAAREAASKAKKMGAMLDGATAGKVARAVDEVREKAKEIVKKLVAGEAKAEIVRGIKLEAVASARFAFIDMGESAEVEPLPQVSPRAVDVGEDANP